MAAEIKDRMLTSLEELILCAVWTLETDNHKEDISYIDRRVFADPRVFDAISAGKGRIELLSERIISHSDFVEYGNVAVDGANNSAAIGNYKGFVRNAFIKSHKWIETDLPKDAAAEAQKLKKMQDLETLIAGGEIVPKVTDYFEAWKAGTEERRKDACTMMYGIDDLDAVTGGIHKSNYIVLGATTGMGKTSLALQIAENVRKSGKKVLFFSLEMDAFSIINKLLQLNRIITADEARTGNIKPSHFSEAQAYLQTLTEGKNFIIYESCFGLNDITTRIRNEQPDFVVIDQASHVRPNIKHNSIREDYIEISTEIQRTALKEHAAIMLLCQLKRETLQDAPQLADFQESGKMAQDADLVLVVTGEYGEDEEVQHKTVTILKQRSGKPFKEINLAFIGEYQRFMMWDEEIARRANSATSAPDGFVETDLDF